MRELVLLILTVTTILNLVLFLLIFGKGLRRDKVSLWFASVAFFSFLLTGANLLLRLTDHTLFLSTTYGFGILMVTQALVWSLLFTQKHVSKRKIFSIEALGFSGFLVTLSPTGFIDNIAKTSNVAFQGETGVLFYLYLLLVVYLFAAMIKVLFSAYRASEGIQQRQIQYVLWGMFIYGFTATLFGVIAPAFEKTDYAFLDSTASLVWIVLTTYAIFKHHLFNIKIIAAEISIFILSFIILIKFLLSNTPIDYFINAVLLLFVVLFGYFLMKGVYKEIASREKIEVLAQELTLANEHLRELDKRRTEFVSLASHQLRTPLTAIKGYSSMVLEGSYGRISKKVREAVQRIFESSEYLVAIIEDFLNITRIEQGRMKYEFVTVEMKGLVKDVVRDMKERAKEKGLTLSYKDDKQGKYMATADFEKIKRVIEDLVENAIEHTEEGAIVVTLKKDPTQRKVIVSVKDTGIGLTKRETEEIFARFPGETDTRITSFASSGFGLYIAKKVVAAHKGHLWVESKGKGKGSIFHVELLAE